MIKNLFIRMDKIGDLVLSLNADQWGPIQHENNHWWVSKGLEFIPERAFPQRPCTSFSKNFSLKEFFRSVKWLRLHRPERAFVFHAPWWVGLALLISRVPIRIGRRSQWHSFLTFNYGVRQSRSKGDRHESQFNIDLMQKAWLKLNPQSSVASTLPDALTLKAPDTPKGLLRQHGLEDVDYVVVHPGMAGSALNWPTECYVEFIKNTSKDLKVVITGSPLDRTYIEPLKKELHSLSNILWLDEKLNLQELLVVLDTAKVLVAPSTGVLHLASSLGTPSIGLYSPRRVQRPTRWGPRGKCVFTFVPEDHDPDKDWGQNCMKAIKPEMVRLKTIELARQKKTP